MSLWVSHGISYYSNFLGNAEYKNVSPEQQMFSPYPRIIIMHFTILFGGTISKSIGAPPFAIALMVVLKIIIDLYSHLAEHGYISKKKLFRYPGTS